MDTKMIDHVFQSTSAATVKEMVAKVDKAQLEAKSADPTGEQKRKFWHEVNSGDPKAASALSAAVIEKVNVDVLAHADLSNAFFEVVNLGDADWPVIQTESEIEDGLKIWYLGESNGRPQRQMVTSRTNTMLNMTQYTTPKYKYPWRNLNTGYYGAEYFTRAQNRIRYALNLAIDAKGVALLKAAKLASGLRATLNLHSSVVTANIPDANSLDLSSGYGTAGVWTVQKLKAIFDYAARFTADVESDGGGQLQVKTIFMSSQRISDFWNFVDLVTGYDHASVEKEDPTYTVPTSVRERIWNTGGIGNFMGNTFSIVPRNTLTAAEVLVAFNKPAGKFYIKPSMDIVTRDTSDAAHEKNEESITMSKVFQMTQPSHLTKNYLVVGL